MSPTLPGRFSPASAPVELPPLESLYNPRHLTKKPIGEPKLIWPSLREGEVMAELDSATIPSLAQIARRHAGNKALEKKEQQLLGCKIFWETLRRSELIFIFDRYLSPKLMRRLRGELTPNFAPNLECLLIIGGTVDPVGCTKMAKEIQIAYATSRKKAKVHLLNHMESRIAPFPHDRFAVTNGEFWHFGGSAGGIEECLTAVSRGWSADEIGVAKLIESAWNALSPFQRAST